MSEYKKKYLKYKNKYLQFKNLIGGNDIFKNRFTINEAVNRIMTFLETIPSKSITLDIGRQNQEKDFVVYWINRHGGFCAQDYNNYMAKNQINKLCLKPINDFDPEEMCKGTTALAWVNDYPIHHIFGEYIEYEDGHIDGIPDNLKEYIRTISTHVNPRKSQY